MSTKFVALKDPTGTYGHYTEAYHQLYKRSSWIVARRFASRQLTEGDFVTVFSQFGEVKDVRYFRHHKSGHCVFIQYFQPESAILAADNMNSGRAPEGKKVYLTADCKRVGVALQVDRCDDAEVPPLPEGAESYRAWYEREMLGVDQ